MDFLVAGGAGFIGSHFVRKIIDEDSDASVTVLDALTYAGRMSNLSGLENRIKFIHGSILDESLVSEAVKRSDIVVNFAAETHNDNSLEFPDKFISTNVIGTFNLIDACRKFDVRYHQVSTDEVFGDLPLDTVHKFDRNSPYSPSSPYSASKASADLLVKAWVRSFGLRATISISGNNYGTHQHEEKFIPRSVLSAASGMKPKLYGNGLNVRDWIHVEDHVDGILRVLNHGVIGETYILGSESERSNLQVIEIVLRTMGLGADYFEFTEDRPGHDLRYALDSSASRNELGWKPRHENFEKSVVPVIEHYLHEFSSEALPSLNGHTT